MALHDCYVCEQMRWFICIKLASWLRMRVPSKPAAPSPVCSRKNSIALDDLQLRDAQLPADVKAYTTDQLLMVVATGG